MIVQLIYNTDLNLCHIHEIEFCCAAISHKYEEGYVNIRKRRRPFVYAKLDGYGSRDFNLQQTMPLNYCPFCGKHIRIITEKTKEEEEN